MFYKAESHMIERKDLSDGEKMLIMVLQALSERQGYCFATNAKLATMVGWSVDKLRNNLRTLVEKGIVEYELEDGNRRRLTLPQGGVQFDTHGGVQNDTGGCVDLHRGVYENTQGGVQNDTPLHNRKYNRTLNREINRSEQRENAQGFFDSDSGDSEKPNTHQPNTQRKKVAQKKERVEIVMPWDSEVFTEAWGLWKQYKKEEHRFGYKSEISEQAALKKLAEMSGGYENKAIEIINNAINNGWKGFFPITEKQSNNGKRQPVTEELMRDIANDIANGGWNFAEGA